MFSIWSAVRPVTSSTSCSPLARTCLVDSVHQVHLVAYGLQPRPGRPLAMNQSHPAALAGDQVGERADLLGEPAPARSYPRVVTGGAH